MECEDFKDSCLMRIFKIILGNILVRKKDCYLVSFPCNISEGQGHCSRRLPLCIITNMANDIGILHFFHIIY